MENNVFAINSVAKVDINVDDWREYRIGDLFESQNGDYDIQSKDINNKGYIVVTSGTTNYGVLGKTDVEAKIFQKNTITIDMFGNSFYRGFDYKMVTHGRVFSVSIKNKNIEAKKSLLYISAILNNLLPFIFSYGHMCSWNRVKDIDIQLPSKFNTETKQYEPDWQYMEDYISDLENDLRIEEIKQVSQNIFLVEEESIDVDGWREFLIVDLFEIEKGQRLNKEFRRKGYTPFLTSTSENNGVSDYIDKDVIKMDIQSNSITIDMFYNVFYHKYDFLCDDNVHILKPKFINLTQNKGFFLATVLKHNKNKYHYGQQLRIKHLIKETINLPSKFNEETKQYEPDWQYMEDYISGVKEQLVRSIDWEDKKCA